MTPEIKIGDYVKTNSRWNASENPESGIIKNILELNLPTVIPVYYNGFQTSELIFDNSGDVDIVYELESGSHFHWTWLEKGE